MSASRNGFSMLSLWLTCPARLKMMSCPRTSHFMASLSRISAMLTVSWLRMFSILKKFAPYGSMQASTSVTFAPRGTSFWASVLPIIPSPPVIKMRFPSTKDAKSVMPLLPLDAHRFLDHKLWSLFHFVVDAGEVFADNPDRNQVDSRQDQDRDLQRSPARNLVEFTRQSSHD